ncbi:MAG: type II secretion system GspH family protein [Defluviitaleaceae bacterium]|nr:type II secretion system GspH family protein [Defluviitaleaceae bacterium]
MIKRTLNTKGVTLMELIVAMLVFSIIMAAATSAFAPMLNAFRRANNFAEANTLMDNLAMHVLADINNAIRIDTDKMSIHTPSPIYYDEFEGFLMRDTSPDRDNPNPLYVLDRGFYRNIRIDEFYWDEDSPGLISVTFVIEHITDGWKRERTYTARPVGLMPTP